MEHNILIFIVVGFLAQAIDGALGMAYGVSSTSFLLSIGISPAANSASVHTAEIFTTGESGLSHLKLGHVNKKAFARLLIPGVLGGVLGAYILTAVPGGIIHPFVSICLLVTGITTLRRSLQTREPKQDTRHYHLIPPGMAGGFFDAIGSVNLTEFFVTLVESVTFALTIGLVHWKIILGLMIGGWVAASVAAYVCKYLPYRVLMTVVGVVIIGLSTRTLCQVLA